MPSTRVYLTSPSLSFATELNIAVIGVLFFGSPDPQVDNRFPFFAQQPSFFVERKGWGGGNAPGLKANRHRTSVVTFL